ncbi:MAG TPA: polysaccharide biosynthesis C-terminal domain-containing protein [Chryseolinea sp.]|nr:polysaccharide biosynthesis C-terminal domain-containing protein [Chryseolinea sp.]HPM30518.1 polysaccharide biosynthesis C-terminal domain-containing protein [Chryseolinea sp.]
MGSVIRQSILTSIISYIGVLIGYVNLLYLYPKFLVPEQIGLLRAIQDSALLLAPFATVGLAQGIARYFPQFSISKSQTNTFTGLIMLLGVAGYGFFIVIFLSLKPYIISFFAKNASDVVDNLTLILWLTFILVFIAIVDQFSKAILKIVLPNFLKEIGIRVFQGVLVSLYFLSIITFDQLIIGSVLIYMLSLFVLAFYLYKSCGFGFSFKDISTIPRQKILEIIKYSAFSFISVSAMILVGKMDSLMVAGFLGLTSVAVYTTAFYMATVIEIPKRAITQTTTTLIARALEKNDIKEVHLLYCKTSINQLIIGLLLLTGVWANIENIFSLMPKGDLYASGTNIVLLIGIGKLIDMAFGPSSEIIGLSRYYKFNMVSISFLAIIVFISNYILIPKFGIDGAAYGTLFALGVYNSVKFFYIYSKFKIQPFTIGTLKVIGIAILVAGLNLILPKLNTVIIDVLYRSAIITLCFSALILLSKSSLEINSIFNKIVERFRYR